MIKKSYPHFDTVSVATISLALLRPRHAPIVSWRMDETSDLLRRKHVGFEVRPAGCPHARISLRAAPACQRGPGEFQWRVLPCQRDRAGARAEVAAGLNSRARTGDVETCGRASGRHDYLDDRAK